MNFLRRLFSKMETEFIADEGTMENSAETMESANTDNEVQEAPAKKDEGVVDIHHLIVLDESGSMHCVTDQTISGCNETIQTVRQMAKNNPDTQRHYVSIYVFNSNGCGRYLIEDMPIDRVKEITYREYSPNGCTALFDAVGHTLTELSKKLKDDSDMAYVTIITDGMENDSKEFTLDQVRELIDALKTRGVVFSFIGANIDAASYSRLFHIDNYQQFEQDAEGTHRMWEEERRSKMRSNAKMEFMRRHMQDEYRNFIAEENRGRYYDRMNDAFRITPNHITSLAPNEVFVFGSNVRGMHTGGASAFAVKNFGAQMGQAEGMQGQSYAIPTVGVSEDELFEAIMRFTVFAAQHPELRFLVTPIGCGNGGWQYHVVAPMFRRAARLQNVCLPEVFWEYNE